MIDTLNIRRKIPEPIKKIFRWLYRAWSIDFDKEIIANLSERFSMSEKDARWFLKSNGRMTNFMWRSAAPKTEEEIKKFYEQNPFYIFDLIFWHSTRYQSALRRELSGIAKGSVLDYGGGAGFLSMNIADKGIVVDYADLEGRTFDFARWIFTKRGYRNINVINLSKESISKKYDTIFCIDVLEHSRNQKNLLKEIVGYLNPGGKLALIVDYEFSEGIPLHFEISFNVSEYLQFLGLIETSDSRIWIKGSNNIEYNRD